VLNWVITETSRVVALIPRIWEYITSINTPWICTHNTWTNIIGAAAILMLSLAVLYWCDPRFFPIVGEGVVVFYTHLRFWIFARENETNGPRKAKRASLGGSAREVIDYGLVVPIVESGSSTPKGGPRKKHTLIHRDP